MRFGPSLTLMCNLLFTPWLAVLSTPAAFTDSSPSRYYSRFPVTDILYPFPVLPPNLVGFYHHHHHHHPKFVVLFVGAEMETVHSGFTLKLRHRGRSSEARDQSLLSLFLPYCLFFLSLYSLHLFLSFSLSLM